MHNTATPQLLTSALVYVSDCKNNLVKCRALLDTCSTTNFISESVVRRLGIPVVANSMPIGAINATSTKSRGLVRATVQSIHDDFRKELTCLIVSTITELVPSETFPREAIKIPSNIKLADPNFHLPRPVDLLIGSGTTLSLFRIGQINLSHAGHDLYIQKTRLGWVVAGSTSFCSSAKSMNCQLIELENRITKFWAIEKLSGTHPKSKEEIECEAHFAKTTLRNAEGRYVVSLPFRNTSKHLGESRNMAIKRFLALERKFERNASFKDEYTRAFEQYLISDYITAIDNAELDGYYMPHHAVLKESSDTTKIRIVFDASAKTTTDTSLNDVLMVGPMIQDTLFTHLIRFRTYEYAITADIEKMYLQVLVREDERKYQRVVWRKNDRVETFQLNTLAFGVSSSSFLAIRTLHQLANDECRVFPRAVEILKTHLYVDNLLSGANDIDEARLIRDDITALLARGGFNIRQWASNDERIIKDMPTRALHASLAFDTDRSLKTLGISWSIRNDEIYYSTNPIQNTERLMKRIVLSAVAKIFDPLGLLGPVVLCAKKLMQDVWRSGVHWNESGRNAYTLNGRNSRGN